jgi:hypothetical protein
MPARKWKLGLTAALMVCAACASTHPPVKHISFSGLPVDDELRARALEIAAEDFPRVQQALHCPAGRREFSIKFKRIWHGSEMAGYTAGEVIELNPVRLTNNPARFAFTLRHEMAHLLQNYATGAPPYWREGICDYVAWQLSGDPDGCQCTGQFPHYTAGYRCAAAFLSYLAASYQPEIVPRLHGLLVQGGYSDKWFESETGKDLASLWAEFQATSGFTPAARDRNALDEALKVPGLSREQEAELFRAFMISQPGGAQIIEAADYLKGLATEGKLPGFEHGRLPSAVSLQTIDFEQAPEYPRTQTIRFISPDKRDLFIYAVTKASEGATWQLVDACRVDNRSGKSVKRYQVALAKGE